MSIKACQSLRIVALRMQHADIEPRRTHVYYADVVDEIGREHANVVFVYPGAFAADVRGLRVRGFLEPLRHAPGCTQLMLRACLLYCDNFTADSHHVVGANQAPVAALPPDCTRWLVLDAVAHRMGTTLTLGAHSEIYRDVAVAERMSARDVIGRAFFGRIATTHDRAGAHLSLDWCMMRHGTDVAHRPRACQVHPRRVNYNERAVRHQAAVIDVWDACDTFTIESTCYVYAHAMGYGGVFRVLLRSLAHPEQPARETRWRVAPVEFRSTPLDVFPVPIGCMVRGAWGLRNGVTFFFPCAELLPHYAAGPCDCAALSAAEQRTHRERQW